MIATNVVASFVKNKLVWYAAGFIDAVIVGFVVYLIIR